MVISIVFNQLCAPDRSVADDEPGELSQWLCYDDITIIIIIMMMTMIIIISPSIHVQVYLYCNQIISFGFY